MIAIYTQSGTSTHTTQEERLRADTSEVRARRRPFVLADASDHALNYRQFYIQEHQAADSVIETRFNRLVDEWKRETIAMSSISQIARNDSYQQIIGMGEPVIPYILRELGREPDEWFWALMAITGENPVPEADEGNLARMSQAWIRWGRERGYIDNPNAYTRRLAIYQSLA